MENLGEELNLKKHAQCHKRFLSLLPSKYQSDDSNKLAIAYFSLASLELMNLLHETFSEKDIAGFIEYIYLHLIEDEIYSGFRGSFIYIKDRTSIDLASTCFALQCLIILRDDLKRVNNNKILNFLQACQLSDGGFTNMLNSEYTKDVRYCMIALTIFKILKKNRPEYQISDYIKIQKLREYIYSLQNYDGGFPMYKGDESHGGMVFCAVDSLSLLGDFQYSQLGAASSSKYQQIKSLVDFIVHRQINFGKYNNLEFEENEYADLDDNGGFNGRLNKYGDTCYVFWSLASLELLGYSKLIDSNAAKKFLLEKTQNLFMGGFNKTTDSDEFPDPLHSFLGLAALSILKYPKLGTINCELVIPESSCKYWESA